MKKVLAITVGTGREGQPADPIYKSIKQENPDHILFFVTKESNEITLPKVLERIEFKSENYKVRFCKDENDVIACYTFFKNELQHLIKDGIKPENIVVDYTTGTKAMSAALVLAGTSLGVYSLIYVAGQRENGIVISGTEKVYPISPNDLYWGRLHNQAVVNFNAYHFQECLNIIETMLPMIASGEKKEKATFLKGMAESYLAWDLFDIISSLAGLEQCAKQSDLLNYYGCKEAVETNVKFIKTEMKSYEYVKDKTSSGIKRYSKTKAVDLYFNAQRRLSEGKYDDAVARIYRLLEYMAQARLLNEYEIETKNVDVSTIPKHCKALFKNVGTEEKTAIGLSQCFELLNCLGDKLGVEYYKRIGDMKEILGSRNKSILAHGFIPVSAKTAQKMVDLIEPIFNIFIEKPLSKYKGAEFPKLMYR